MEEHAKRPVKVYDPFARIAMCVLGVVLTALFNQSLNDHNAIVKHDAAISALEAADKVQAQTLTDKLSEMSKDIREIRNIIMERREK